MAALDQHHLRWGAYYSVRDVLDDPPGVSLQCGLAPLDGAVGDLGPGSVLVIAGPRASGVSMLALTYAGYAVEQQRMTALVVNSHLQPAALVARMGVASPPIHGAQAGSGGDDLDPGFMARLSVASGCGLLPGHDRVRGWMSPEPTHDVIVYDTFDEVWPVGREKTTPAERTTVLRSVRDAARIGGSRVIATLRVASPHSDLRRTRKRWHAHPWYEAVMDAADVVVMTSGYACPGATNPCVVMPRTGGHWFISLTVAPDRKFQP